MLRTEITKSHLSNHICQHRGMKTSTVTPSFYYVFNISLYCYDTIPNFIGNLWRVLLPGNHLKFIHLSKLHNRIQRANAYSVKKIYLFLESNDQYGRKKNFSTVVLLYDESIFINILKNQPPNVNFCRKVLQTCSKAVRPRR